MKHLLPLLFCLCLALPGQAQDKTLKVTTLPTGTERRVALVVGNRDYEFMRPLQNPLNDADDMTVTLRKMGFAVTTLKNTDYRTLANGITTFIAALSGSDVALFYFSGHGVGFNGQNYIIPTNARVECLERIANEGISIEKILNGFEDRKVRNSFMFLDACRNLPNYPGCYDQSRSGPTAQGLTIPTSNPRGSFIAFATADGRTADDNPQERNGLFTRELVRYLPQPNLSIRSIMDRVTTAVRQRSGQKQQPKRYEDLEGDFFFLVSQTMPVAPNLQPVVMAKTDQSSSVAPTSAKAGFYLDLPFADMVYIPGGTFQMGDRWGDGYSNEKPVHSVTVSSFWMGKYEVTQRQWEAVMGNNPSAFKNCPDCPVEQVSWDDVQEFLQKLNARTGGNYRLPTEAEWEYAAGGGSANRTRFGNGRDVIDPAEANFEGSESYKKTYSMTGVYRGKTVRVGSFVANVLGLHEMSGNVLEWCSDWHGGYPSGDMTNPTGPSTGSARVLRGGSWFNLPQAVRVAFRYNDTPPYRSDLTGFRIVSQVQ